MRKELLEGLLQINCTHSYKEEFRDKEVNIGKCYSKICMLNQNKDVANDIQTKGCEIYKKINRKQTMENEKRKLQVGDKLYKRGDNRWGRESLPEFASVVRLTATQALLSNGIRLKNEIRIWGAEVCFSEVGTSFVFWYFETPEIVEEAKRLKEESRIRRWFELKKWDIEEMKLIYETFKEKNLLNEAKEN